jgi:hypothetical protein
MAYPFNTFEIGDAQSGSWIANRPFWIALAVIASVCVGIFYTNCAYFWTSVTFAVIAWIIGLGGHAKVIVDSAKRQIRFSRTTLWSEKTHNRQV